MGDRVSIVPCPAAKRPDALRVLHAGLPVDQQMGLVQALQSVRDASDAVFDGLLIAIEHDDILCAGWSQLAPGKTAVIWLPAADSSAAPDVARALADFLDEHRITLAQFLATDNDRLSAEVLAAGGFERLAKLSYLSAPREVFPLESPTSELEFVPCASEHPQRLGKLLIRTYEDSLDCPGLNGVRHASDVLAGYREQGEFAADRWFFVQCDGEDIGALILTVHLETGNWELVYMGLVPEQRGKRYGRAVLDFAMWQAAQSNAERLVLAVDESNSPALDTYQRAGFSVWDHRTVYARLRPQSA